MTSFPSTRLSAFFCTVAGLTLAALLLTAFPSIGYGRDRIDTLRPGLSSKAKKQLGADFACLNGGGGSREPGLYLLVTSASARKKGLKIVRDLHAEGLVSVRRVASQYSLRSRQALLRRLNRDVPAESRAGLLRFELADAWGSGYKQGRYECPPVRIFVAPESSAQSWGESQRDQFGPDRVTIVLGL